MPLYVMVSVDYIIFLHDNNIRLADPATKRLAIAKNGNEEHIFVRANSSVDYVSFMEVMVFLYSSGYRKIGLVTGNIDKKAGTPN